MISAIGAALPRLDTARVDSAGSIGTTSMPGATQGTPATDFSSVLKEVAADAVDTMKSAEATSIQGIKGQASTQAVVDAVMQAERTLQTAVALRDKVVAAYQEMSRMSI